MKVVQDISQWIHSGQSGIVVSSVEPEDCVTGLTEYARQTLDTEERWDLVYHDDVDGLTDIDGNIVVLEQPKQEGLQFGQPKPTHVSLTEALYYLLSLGRARQQRADMPAVATAETAADDQSLKILYVRNFDRKIFPHGHAAPPDLFLLTLLQKVLLLGQSMRLYVVMQTTPSAPLPDELVEHCQVIHHGLPDTEERRKIVEESVGVDADHEVLDATAGLSRTKTAQFAAYSMLRHQRVHPATIFRQKAEHLSRASKLEIWSPAFRRECVLVPVPENQYSQHTEVRLLEEQHRVDNKHLAEHEVRVRIAYATSQGIQEVWLDPMPKETFELQFRPERDYYSFKSIVGLQGLKDRLRKGLRVGQPVRAMLKHVLMVGVPGVGKTMTQKCCSGEFGIPLCVMNAAKLYDKYLGETDKALDNMLRTVEKIGGILAIDEFQRFLPTGGADSGSGGVESRLLGSLQTWFNDQSTNLVLSAANLLKGIPPEVTRSGRVDMIVFVGYPSREARDAAWSMYIRRHELDKDQSRPDDEFWTPQDIASCCRLAEQQQCSLVDASDMISPKTPDELSDLFHWAKESPCVCAETGRRYTGGKVAKITTVAGQTSRKRTVTSGKISNN